MEKMTTIACISHLKKKKKTLILCFINEKLSYRTVSKRWKMIQLCLTGFILVSPAVFNKEDDIGTYTIRAVDDPRTLNKILYIKPPQNIYSFNDLVSLWEKKIGKTLERIHVPKEQVLKNIQG